MKLINYLVILIAGLSLSSCVGEDIKTVDEKNITFEKSFFSIAVDESDQNLLKLGANFTSTLDPNQPFEIIYKSDNENVLKVTNEGLLMPVSKGTAEITVSAVSSTSGGNNAKSLAESNVLASETLEILVSTITLSTIEVRNLTPEKQRELAEGGYSTEVKFINPLTSISIDETETKKLNAVFSNIQNVDEELPITWSSSNSEILEIASDGTLTPKQEGKATITASINPDDSSKSGNKPSDKTSNSIEITVSKETVVDDTPTTPSGTVVGFGTFQSNSSYAVSGGFEIKQNGNSLQLILDDKFNGSTVPDLVIYASNSQTSNAGAAIITEDVVSTGAQTFTIPASININEYSTILLYCRAFSVRVGFGTIQR